MRVIFFGTPAFAVPSLNALIHSDEEVVAVVTQPDKRKGREHVLSPSPVKELALGEGIRVLQPVNLRNMSFFEELSAIRPEIITVVAYGKILPSSVLRLPPHGCINVHASLLPKYRGAAPVQWALINGEKTTGVTTMLMDEGLDTGDILLQEEIEIRDDDNTETLSRRLSELGASLLMKTIKKIKEESIKPAPQTGIPSYAPPLKKEDGRIDWSKEATDIFNFVRGMYPWPGAYCYFDGERIKIHKVKLIDGTGKAGRIEKVGDELIVGTGKGLISIIQLQPQGKRSMTTNAFIQGRRVKEGAFFDEQ
ncbi:MAG: methionyl-tRNA formyltransferase [Nitrospirota bacterium]